MPYPFENIRASVWQSDVYQKKLPHVTSVMPEFFRVMTVAFTSIGQKNLYGMPRGIRQDLGVETSLKLLLVACFNDRLITANESPKLLLEKLRVLVLLWFAMGANLNACLFFGYYFYAQHSNALYVVKNLLGQIDFLVDVAKASREDADVHRLFGEQSSKVWYRSAAGIGDKLRDVYVPDGDFTRTDLPRPGYQLHFKKSGFYDLRAPMFIDASDVEAPLINQGKVIVSCPKCKQKCRVTLFAHIEVSCPMCQKTWAQRT
jgi:hypothetical protein